MKRSALYSVSYSDMDTELDDWVKVRQAETTKDAMAKKNVMVMALAWPGEACSKGMMEVHSIRSREPSVIARKMCEECSGVCTTARC